MTTTKNPSSNTTLGVRPLADLPNTTGFEFRGVDKQGGVFECVVGLDPIGCHSTYTKWDHEPCFFRLAGWLPALNEPECSICRRRHGSDTCRYAGEKITVVLFEDNNGTRFIYSDAAISAISGPDDSDKVLTTSCIYLPPNAKR